MILEVAATDGSFPCLSSNMRTCCESQASQYWQSAAPPAIVANFCELISMTFLTVSDEMKLPIVALESTAMMIPSLKTKASVVVPNDRIGNTCFEIHDFLLLSIGVLDDITELVGFLDGGLSYLMLIFLEIVGMVSIEFTAQIGAAKSHNLVVHLNIF